jgi:hypothetical protein
VEKKPLIEVSILVVVFLVLGSLSNVVGHQPEKSTAVNDSPLFFTRTLRAVRQQSQPFSAQYLGKDEETKISLPMRDTRTDTIRLILQNMRRMDDTSLKRLAYLIIYNVLQKNHIKGFNSSFNLEEIYQGLKELRNNPDIDIRILEQSKAPKMRSNVCSIDCTFEFSRECWPFLIFFLIIMILDVILLPIGLVLQILTISC